MPAAAVDDVVVGNVIHTGKDAPYLARHIALYAGVPVETPALTVNRLCGSGLQAAISAAHTIRAGEASVALVGGAESMSQAPYVLRNRFGSGIGTPGTGRCPLGDADRHLLRLRHGDHRGEHRRAVRRQPRGAGPVPLLSQQRAAAAAERLAEEIVPVDLPRRARRTCPAGAG